MTNGSCSVRYEALSYCWGTPVFNGEVVIDGQVSHVTESLDTALRHLRSETQTMTLWIDAICINQMDLAERSQQVQGMLDTYQSAHCVYTWLGPSTERTAAGMMALESIWKGREGDGEPAWASMPPDVIGPGLEDILTRPYFERMWVVQETAIAREVILTCGAYSVTWVNKIDVVYPCMRALKAAAVSPQWRQPEFSRVSVDMLVELLQMQLDTGPESRLWKDRRPMPDLLDVAYDTRHRVSSDPRDRFWALLNLVNRSSTQRIFPDYSLPVEEAYLQMEQQWACDTSSVVAKKALSNSVLYSDEGTSGEEDVGHAESMREDEITYTSPMSASGVARQVLTPCVDAASRRTHQHPASLVHRDTQRQDLHCVSSSNGCEPQIDPQLIIIRNHVESTLERTKQLFAADNIGRAAALLEQLAKDVRQCAYTRKTA